MGQLYTNALFDIYCVQFMFCILAVQTVHCGQIHGHVVVVVVVQSTEATMGRVSGVGAVEIGTKWLVGEGC